jgi:hypothetical protein
MPVLTSADANATIGIEAHSIEVFGWNAAWHLSRLRFAQMGYAVDRNQLASARALERRRHFDEIRQRQNHDAIR